MNGKQSTHFEFERNLWHNMLDHVDIRAVQFELDNEWLAERDFCVFLAYVWKEWRALAIMDDRTVAGALGRRIHPIFCELNHCASIHQSKSISVWELIESLIKMAKLVLTSRPTPFVRQSGAVNNWGLELRTIMCWTSLHPRFGLASSVRAIIAAAIGAEPEVPKLNEVRFRLYWRQLTCMMFCTTLVYVSCYNLFFAVCSRRICSRQGWSTRLWVPGNVFSLSCWWNSNRIR